MRLSLEACGASCTRASCHRHFISTGENENNLQQEDESVVELDFVQKKKN